MVMQSGTPPYEYAIRTGRFRVPNPLTSFTGVGFSGILLEQAQFVITAEERRFNQSAPGTFAGEFFLYTNPAIAPSGPYEPKVTGSTLANLINPGAMHILDHILETRTALLSMFNSFAQDTDYTNGEDHLASWLQAAYPESPSGYSGAYLHRNPSETGFVPLAIDVLGASGVLYDIDIGEVMFNPYPYIGGYGMASAHGDLVNGALDDFSIVTAPAFPNFQRTNGTIISLNGREPGPPVIDTGLSDYNVDHIASGYIRLNGYVMQSGTLYTMGKGLQFDGLSDFTFRERGIRETLDAGNLETARVFLEPTPQASGVYRLACVNKFQQFPNTTVESGIVSQWPTLANYWPSIGNLNVADLVYNNGYHVFDDNIWITDSGPDAGSTHRPSGLCILSPWTGHRLWIRFAEMANGTSTGGENWSHFVGLERITTNSILRIYDNPVTTLVATSGRVAFQEYNDNLDYVAETLTLSAITFQGNEFPMGGDVTNFSDMFYDGTHYWVFNLNTTGFDAWKFDNTFEFVEKYTFNNPSGISQTRAAYVNGKHRVYNGVVGIGTTLSLATSGIWDYECTDSSNPAGGTPGSCTLGTQKMINAAPFIGHRDEAHILDLFEVTGAFHVVPGVYATILFKLGSYDLYLLRIVETATTWEVAAITRIMNGVDFTGYRTEMLYMSY